MKESVKKFSFLQNNSYGRRLLVSLIVLVHIALCGWGAWRHSPTMDEPAYLASGISHWQFGRFDLCQVSPPLVRLIAAIPVQLANPKLNWTNFRTATGGRYEHAVGRDFLIENGERSFWLFTLGRWACIPFSLIGACVSYIWAKQLFGIPSAFAALLLWCFSPNILAHAQQLTPDIGVTALSLAACYAFWLWSQSPTKLRVSIAGGILGLAVLAKTNAVALYPALTLGIFFHHFVTKQPKAWQSVRHVLIAFAISIYVINLGYGFEGSFKLLGKYEFFSSTFGSTEGHNRFNNTVLGSIPVPLPSAFIEGIDLQRRDFENKGASRSTYFRGEWYEQGWWWYYFYVVAVKVPIGIWILVLIGSSTLIFRKIPHRTDSLCYLVIPGAALFALACSQTGFGHSLRYVLPAFPFAFVIASAAMYHTASRSLYFISRFAMTWFIISSIYVFPHSLSYFNELAGGPSNGHFHLLDGNVDWGQDYLYIRDWIENNPQATPLHVAYWGCLPLNNMGINFEMPTFKAGDPIPSGWYLISVNHLRQEYRFRHPELAQFLEYTPVERLTYTTYLYHIP